MGRTALLLMLLLTLSCGGQPPGSDGSERVGSPRIAVMAPAGAEMVASLGMLDHAVAAGDFVSWPPAASRLPRIGAYDAPNLEMLLTLDVDLLVTSYSEAGEGVHERVRELGIRVAALQTDTWEHTLDALQELGDAVGRSSRAAHVVEVLRGGMRQVRERTEDLEPRKTLVVVGRRPLYVAGPGSHLDELVRAGGGLNIIASGPPYQLVSMEAVLERLPEVIIDTSHNRGQATTERSEGVWDTWPFLPAVEQGRVWQVHPEIPGPRMPRRAELAARMIHPEVFGPPDTSDLGPLSPADTTALEVDRER